MLRPVHMKKLALVILAVAIASPGCGGTKKRVVAEPVTRDAGPYGSLGTFSRGDDLGESGPLRNVHFDHDRSDVRSEDRAILNENFEWLTANPQAMVQVEGHCDPDGTAQYNVGLGARRAKSAKDYLVTLGIAPERLSTVSYGSEILLCQEESAECYTRNRRVHFAVIGGEAKK